MWFQGYHVLEQIVISQQPIQLSVDQVVEPMKFLANPTLPSESDLHQVVELM